MINEKQDKEKQIEQKHDEFDDVLDAALAKYAAAEPRAGLDERVLANLRAERARVTERACWRWSIVAPLAAIVIVALALAWKSGKQSQIVAQHHPSTTTQAPKEPTKQTASNSMRDLIPSPERGRMPRTNARGSRLKVVVANSPNLDQPKLDQFPSPRPLSEGERLLVRYVQNFPQEAEVIAKEQAEFDQEMEKLNGDQSRKASSDQEER
jgi:hypothetical protein